MKFFKKAREAFSRMVGKKAREAFSRMVGKKAREAFSRMVGKSDDAPPPVRPEPTPPPAEVIQDPRFKYAHDQAYFRTRAKAVTVVHDSSKGPMVLGRNAAKRRTRYLQRTLHGLAGGWKKAWALY